MIFGILLRKFTMQLPQASLSFSSVLDEAAHSPQGGWNAWLESAETVLRGEPVSGPFRVVEDAKQRRFLASALMLGNPSADIDWKRWMCVVSSDRTLRREDFDPRGRFAPDRHAAPAPSLSDFDARCWQRYFIQPYGSVRYRFRRQAAAAFPLLVAVVVLVAHSEDRWPRVRAAWEVIDRIDRGEPLVPALRGFLHVGKAEVRASRQCTLIPPLHGVWSQTRRRLRAVVKLPTDKRPRQSVQWELAYQYLASLALLVRHDPAALARAYPPTPQTLEDLHTLALTNPRARAGILRGIARHMTAINREGWASTRFELLPPNPADHATQWSEAARHELHGEPMLIELPDGWTARALVSIAELEEEGLHMQHCVGHYAVYLQRGDGRFFALRHQNGRDEATLYVALEEADEIEGESSRNAGDARSELPILGIELASMHSAPNSIPALRAMTALLEHLWPGHRTRFL